jgi:exopolysaccharide production protein ExoY
MKDFDFSRGYAEDIKFSTVARIEMTPVRIEGVYTRFGKRALDLLLIAVGLPFVLPLMALMAIAIGLSGGPVFYSQPRIGRGGRVFRFWKFRTMVTDADSVLESHLAENPQAAQEWLVAQKLENDPRITRIGKYLRMTSLDELPQLWNVIIGDMSLVGPRPMMPQQRELYHGIHYEEFRPGLTGYWQVSERNETSFADRARFDARYAREIGLGTDILTIARTFKTVVRATGR